MDLHCYKSQIPLSTRHYNVISLNSVKNFVEGSIFIVKDKTFDCGLQLLYEWMSYWHNIIWTETSYLKPTIETCKPHYILLYIAMYICMHDYVCTFTVTALAVTWNYMHSFFCCIVYCACFSINLFTSTYLVFIYYWNNTMMGSDDRRIYWLIMNTAVVW